MEWQTISRLGDNLYRVALAWWVLEHTGSATAMGTVLIFSFTPMLLFLLIGGVAVDRVPRLRVMWIAYGASLLGGLAVFAVGFPIGVAGIALAFFCLGLTMSFFGLIWTSTVQEMVPRDLMGRVASVDMLGSFVFLPVGWAIAGWATDLAGAPAVFVAGGALTMALIALGLAHPAIRNLD